MEVGVRVGGKGVGGGGRGTGGAWDGGGTILNYMKQLTKKEENC